MVMLCHWCGEATAPQRGGAFTKRFCSAACRNHLHTAARRWGLAALDTGMITPAMLKLHPAARESRVEATPRRPKKAAVARHEEAST
jgi:hypothetical protein